MVFANDSSHSLYKNISMTSDLVWTFTFVQVPYFEWTFTFVHFWTIFDTPIKYSEKIPITKIRVAKKTSSISCRFRTLLFPSRIEAQTRLHIYEKLGFRIKP